MQSLRKITVAAAVAAVLAAGAVSATARPQAGVAQVETLVVGGNIEWIQRSAVAARHEGIVEKVEMTIGKEVGAGQTIALLDATNARLAAEKAEMMANDETAVRSADAEKSVARANLARVERLRAQMKDIVSQEEYELKQAQFQVAAVKVEQEVEKVRQAKKESELAAQIVEDHIVDAPFDGEIVEVLKQPGEAVQAMEPVVQLARTDRVRFFGYVPLEVAYRLKKGMIVDVTPIVEGADLPIEQKRFRGKIVFIGPELVGGRTRAEVQVKADIVNNVGKELRIGHRADMTVYLTDDQALIPPPPADMLPIEDEAAAPAAALSRRAAAPAQ